MNCFRLGLIRPARSPARRPRALRVLDLLEDRTNPVVVTGTDGNDVITTRLVFSDGATEPHAADVLVNDAVAATVGINGFWPFPTTTWSLAEPLEIQGLGGDDHISVGLVRPMGDRSGNLIVRGGAGNDTLVGGNGHDYLFGDAGADDLSAGIDEDSLYADADDVRLVGGGGIDLLILSGISGTATATAATPTSPGSLTINGRTLSEADGTYVGIGAVELHGSDGPDVLTSNGYFWAELFGNGGNDRLETDASSNSRAEGGDGNDTLTGGGGPDRLYGGAGNDLLWAGIDDFPDFTVNFLDGGAGDDILLGGTAPNTLVGDAGNDLLTGGPLGDGLYGEEGSDTLFGLGGGDALVGDSGWDTEHPVAADVLDAGAGDDFVTGDALDTRLAGGTGLDGLLVTGIRGTAVLTNAAITINGRRVPGGGFESATLAGSDDPDTLDARQFAGSVYLAGFEGNDVLRAGPGGPGGNTLEGGPGADAMSGGAGDDGLIADGDDTRMAGGGGTNSLAADGIRGTAVLTDAALTINGRRIVTGGMSGVFLGGSDGDDVLDASRFSGMTGFAGYEGNDVLRAGPGASGLDGGPGADALEGGAGDDNLAADAADIRITGAGGTDSVSIVEIAGTAIMTDTSLSIEGRPVVFGGIESASLFGSEEADVLNAAGFGGALTLVGYGGNDALTGGGGGALLSPGPGDDTVTGGQGPDVMDGEAGADDLDGAGGDDTVIGDAADTRLEGGSGTNTLTVNGITGTAVLSDASLTINGRAVLFGGFGTVGLYAGDLDGSVSSDDTFDASGFSGSVTLAGGYGNDILIAGSGGSGLYGGVGNDQLTGGVGIDLLFGDWGDDTLTGGAGNDELYGDQGDDELTGGDGDDYLTGWFGEDTLRGEAGSDYLSGGDFNRDILLGGADADSFQGDYYMDVRAWEQENDDFDAAEGDTEV